ncbi:ATP-binding protein [Phormidium tenue FACHB-886]|nr:ATP-binding protein [Phormidium tenue FACHB-886]
MSLDLTRFARACNPSRTLMVGNPEDQPYYIDFASVRGGKIIEALERTVTRLSPNEPTCQLFTGHIGCGKSTELYRLKAELEQQNFYVVYFEADQDLEVDDVDVTDILLAIARQVSEALETINIRLRPSYFERLFAEMGAILRTPIELSAEAEFSIGVGKIIAKTKSSPQFRSQLRQYLETRTSSILESLNEELLGKAIAELQRRQKKGLVVIVDNLDRIENRPNAAGRPQPEYLFIDRGSQLRELNCHLVYTVPLSLMFSSESQALNNRLGGGIAPKVLPMVPALKKDGAADPEGMALLRQLVLARAFPETHPVARIDRIPELFTLPETLDRLCQFSGGHMRNLLGLLYGCLQEQDPPFSVDCLATVIRTYKDDLALSVKDEQWELLKEVTRRKMIGNEPASQHLLANLFVFEYRSQTGRWFDLNPALKEILEG